VLEKKNNAWRLVQMHFSFAADKVQKSTAAPAQSEVTSPAPDAYQEDRRRLGTLVKEEKFQQAADLLKSMLEKHPDHWLANSYNAAYVYGRLGRFEEGLHWLEGALAKGLWFGQWDFDGKVWDGFRTLPGFQQVVERSRLSRLEAAKSAAMKLEVSLPAGHNPAQRYPLFLALHGGGENLAEFRPHWTSSRLQKDFLVAYVQSSQLASMTGFHWQDIEITSRDLGAALQQLTEKYSIDQSRIVIGGFSSGGFAALTLSLKGLLPARGFVALCPPPPDSITPEDIQKARERGVRGTILTTEMDGRLTKQRELANRLQEGGFQYQFRVTPNGGHWYPEDLAARIDQALDHIEGK
jgi:predicted esterase